MKKLIIILATMFLTACASTGLTTPHMQLSHQPSLQKQFAQLGTVEIKPFIDYRPMYERMLEGADIEDNLRTRVTSAYARPAMTNYLQSVLKTEIQRTGIFAETKEPKYELSGIIYNLSTGIASEGAESNVFSRVDNKGKAVHRYYFAKVKFLAVLKRHGKIVYRKVFYANRKISADKPMSVSEQAKFLDDVLTQTVDELFTSLERRRRRL